jgi:hypothetical protein
VELLAAAGSAARGTKSRIIGTNIAVQAVQPSSKSYFLIWQKVAFFVFHENLKQENVGFYGFSCIKLALQMDVDLLRWTTSRLAM